ncbi:MAG: TfoX/Sxy family protein [Anaerolineales bacterium]|nr:MAG: TfoX/Sxy family protein [Anaerolineales bacterium]
MAYDEGLAQRVREIVEGMPGLDEKKMFGGVGFLLHGNMACGVHKEALIVRVGAEQDQAALSKPHTRPFDITGRVMKGWVMVDAAGYESDDKLRGWVQLGVDFSMSLPPK